MARKYYGSFYSVTGKLHRVEIWDGPTGTTPEIIARQYNARVQAAGGYIEGQTCCIDKLNGLNSSIELTLSGQGYEIQRDGEGDTFYDSPVRPSRSTSFWSIPLDTILGEFKAIATNTEQYWAVLIYQDDSLVHVGRVVADQMQFKREAIEAKPTVELAAVDGLELLDGFQVDPDWFTDGKITISQLFRNCLDVLNLKEYWVINGTNTDYFRDAVSPYSSDALRKGIDLLKVDINTFVDDYDPFKDIKATDVSTFLYASNNMVSCKQAIEQLCDILQARFVHEIGKYWLVSAAEYLDTTVAYRQYSYTLQYIGASTYNHITQLGNKVRPQWAAKPTLTYQPAAKFVQVDTERTMNTGVHRTFGYSASASLIGEFPGVPTGATPDDAPMRIRFALKFSRYIFTTVGPEDESRVKIKIWLTNSAGDIRILDNQNFYWIPATVVPEYIESIKTDTQSTTWTSFVFDKQVTTAPAGFDTLHVVAYQVLAVKTLFLANGGISPSTPPAVAKPFWGSIQIAFADQSPYNNPDFTFNVTEVYTPDTNSGLNSVPVILNPKYYYSSNRYATGNIFAFNGTTDVIADDWYGGWDSTTHGSPTEIMGKGFAGLYKDFVPVIQGTWIDAGTLTAIKSLYFDDRKWLLNGVVYTARSEQWEGEWLGLIPVYTGLTSSGEGLKVGTGLKDRVNYQDEQIARLNDSVQRTPALVLNHLINEAEGAPTTAPTQNTRYEVMVHYNEADEQMVWHLQEHNASVTYTAGTHTITNGYELIICDSTDGNVTVNLPPANQSKGKKYYFKNLVSAHVTTINGNGFNIDAAGSYVLGTAYASATVISNGVQWFLV